MPLIYFCPFYPHCQQANFIRLGRFKYLKIISYLYRLCLSEFNLGWNCLEVRKKNRVKKILETVFLSCFKLKLFLLGSMQSMQKKITIFKAIKKLIGSQTNIWNKKKPRCSWAEVYFFFLFHQKRMWDFFFYFN